MVQMMAGDCRCYNDIYPDISADIHGVHGVGVGFGRDRESGGGSESAEG